MTQFNYTHDFSIDYDLSQIYLKDFEDDQDVSYFSDSNYLVIFGEGEREKPHFKVSHLRKKLKADLFDLAFELDAISIYTEFKEVSRNDLIEELLGVTKEKFIEHQVAQMHWRNLEYSFDVNGYIQGDAKRVLVVGKIDSFINQDYLQKLFFDSPIFCRATVYDESGEVIDEIDFIEYVKDQYSVEQAELLEICNEHYKEKDYYTSLLWYVEKHMEEVDYR